MNPMPAVFFGHGSPMNALETNRYTTAWRAFGQTIPKPRAIRVISQDPNDERADAMLARARSTNGSTPANSSPPKRGRSRAARRAEPPND